MGLSASMWTSVSGLLQHGEKMNIVGNNIANISTVGFKSQRMDFEDLMYQNGFSASGPTQIGRGVGTSTVMGDFSQGGAESTNSATDLLIDGSGFFEVKDPYSDQVFYTRAGNFSFTNDGVLRNPAGYAVQGWEIPDNSVPNISISGETAEEVTISAMQGAGNPKDIRFNGYTIEPKQTSYAEMTVNLNSGTANNKSHDANNPMFSLFNVWDGTQPPSSVNKDPIASDAFMHSSTMKVYDEGGTPRNLTTYYDQVPADSIENLLPGYRVYEYIVTMDPSEDLRTYGGRYDIDTGTVKDDFTTWGDGSVKTMANANLTDASLATYSGGPTTTVNEILNALNAELTRIGAAAVPPVTHVTLTVDSVNVVEHPSGDWSLDPNDANVRKVLADTDAAGAANRTTLTNASTEILPAAIPPENANLVKNMAGTESSGILMMGTMVFNGSGQLVDQSAYTYGGQERLGDNEISNLDPNNLDSWQPAPVSSNGYPVLTPNFSGHPLANTPYQSAGPDNIDHKDAAAYLIEFNMGLKSNLINNPWTNTDSAATVGSNYSNSALFSNSETTSNKSTSFSSPSANNSPWQDGYSHGSLSNYYIDGTGVLHGVYSNSVTKPLYQVAVYDFTNEQGLRREGGNVYSATTDSGQPRVGPAGQNGLGTIAAYSIEQSNVDLSREFVQMISTQRGYQANSKTITTVDSMLETVIGLVR